MFFEKDYIMWLARVEGISLKKKEILLEYFINAKNIFNATNKEIKDFCIKFRINYENILIIKDEDILHEYLDEMQSKNINFIQKEDESYPFLLKNIIDPPLGIYVIGEIPKNNISVSIIGARKCTQYGATNAYKFGKELAQKGITITSGMALGIDSMAHKGAIDGNGKTIAVLGCGVDVVYPQSNVALRREIIKNGCIISEFAPTTPPYANNFPVRNRIISGISDAVIVVEAGKRSGTLITVGQALEQGRDVFAIPGNINNAMSEGTNELIKECAYPLTKLDDILNNLGIINKFSNNYTKEKTGKSICIDNPIEQKIYECIESSPISIDEIILKTNIDIQTIQYNLIMLEMKSYIKKIAGQKYIKDM